MDTQEEINNAIHNGATAGSHVLRGKSLHTVSAIAGDDAEDASALATLTQLPGINYAYRTLRGWHEQFSPRVYGDTPVLIETSRPGQ